MLSECQDLEATTTSTQRTTTVLQTLIRDFCVYLMPRLVTCPSCDPSLPYRRARTRHSKRKRTFLARRLHLRQHLATSRKKMAKSPRPQGLQDHDPDLNRHLTRSLISHSRMQSLGQRLLKNEVCLDV